MNLKPFNLSAFQKGAVAVTRDGRKVQYVGMMPESRKFNWPVVAVFDGEDELKRWTDKGWFAVGSGHDDDLFMMPEKVEGWMNVYSNVSGACAYIYRSRQEANLKAGSKRIACIPISYYDGEGLEPEPQSKEG